MGRHITGMTYQFRVFKYSKFISLIWKGPYYDKINVTSIKKENFDSKKILQSLQLSKSQIPNLSFERPSEMLGHSSVSNINNDAFIQVVFLFRVYSSVVSFKKTVRNSKHVEQFPCNRPDAQLSKESSVRTTRTFRPDLFLYREASNCSSLHPSGCFSSTAERHSVFDQL
jgi:hypothetical protein